MNAVLIALIANKRYLLYIASENGIWTRLSEEFDVS
jgi:hypothetical protein